MPCPSSPTAARPTWGGIVSDLVVEVRAEQRESAMVIQQKWRRQRESRAQHSSADTIQKWFRAQKEVKRVMRLYRFTQQNRWSTEQASRVWALVLGHRVRLLLHCSSCRKSIDACRDTLRVLHDVLNPASEAPSPPLGATLDAVAECSLRGDDQLQLGAAIGDRGLAASLLKQIWSERARLHDLVFSKSRWRAFPPPGYLDLSRSLRLALSLDRVARLRSSPARAGAGVGFGAGVSTATPPRFAFGRGANSNSNSNSSSGGGGGGNATGSAERQIRCEGASRSLTDALDEYPSLSLFSSQSPPPSAAPYASSAPSRAGLQHAHVQLDILGADRLCAAQKGGGTDRKPCLRVTLLLPAVTARGQGTGANALSAVKKISRDFSWRGLSPRWGCSLQLALPCPRRLLPPVPPDAETDGDALLDRQAYAALLDWWAGGVIKVEVVDGERFNSDIFLGECDLYLSQFRLGPIAGAFLLSKQGPADRVSGTISLCAYLHLPTVSALLDARGMDDGERGPVLDASPAEERDSRRIAKSVRTSQSRHHRDAISAIETASPPLDLLAPPRRVAEPFLCPPAPPVPLSRHSAFDVAPEALSLSQKRRSQIASCLDGLDLVQASTDLLLGQINSKIKSKSSRGGETPKI